MAGVAYILAKPSTATVMLQTVETALKSVPILSPKFPGEAYDHAHLRLLTDKLSQKVEQLEQEITERKQAEAVVRQLAEQQTAILNALPASVALLDSQGTIRAINEAWKQFGMVNNFQGADYGLGSNYLLVCDAAHGDRVDGAAEAAAGIRAVQTNIREIFTLEYPCHSPQEKRWFQMMVTRLPGNEAGVVVMHLNVTERKLAEEALRESEDALQTLFEAEHAAREQLRNLASYLQTACEKERTLIAREIPDEFGQVLTALKMDLSWIAKRLSPTESALLQKTTSMSSLIDDTIKVVQRVATELRPGILDNLGLAAAIEWQTQQFAERTGLDCDLQLDCEKLELERDLSTALFRVFQETLTNIVLDIELPDGSGLEILNQLRHLKSQLHILILSIYPEEQYAVRAIKAGAARYLTKASAPDELVAAIRTISEGRKYVTRSLAERLATFLEQEAIRPAHESLSDREYQVMCLLAGGKTVGEIARELALNVKTISTYRARILEKLNLTSTAEIMRYAIERGLVK